MLKLILADDEFFILERLKTIVDYREYGFELVGTAMNGRTAMELIEKFEPDLAILDIKMPFLSGLDIAEKIRKSQLHTKIVILTSFDYFDFAKKAIQHQVFSYLLKPVKEDELRETLSDAARELTLFHKNAADISKFNSENFSRLLTNYLSGESIPPADQELLEKSLTDSCVNCFFIIKTANPDGLQDLTLSLRKQIENHVQLNNSIYITINDATLGIFFSSEKSLPYLARKIQLSLNEKFGTSTNIVFCPLPSSAGTWREIHQKALAAVSYTIFLGENSIFALEDIAMEDCPLGEFFSKKELMLALNNGDRQKITEILHHAFLLLENEYRSINNLELLITSLLAMIITYSSDKYLLLKNQSLLYLTQTLINNHNSITALEGWFISYFIQQATDSSQTSADLIVMRTMELVQKHYTDPTLDVQSIASELGYTSNYVSTLFKKTAGLSLVQYITQCRMAAAKELLSGHKLPVSEVYAKVGYSSPYYFSNRYKQYYGYAPSKER